MAGVGRGGCGAFRGKVAGAQQQRVQRALLEIAMPRERKRRMAGGRRGGLPSGAGRHDTLEKASSGKGGHLKFKFKK